MGLTCSLLGHAFEADGVEREREQRGDEVVTVVRETETCSRCGEQRVASETTEVTSVLDRDETALDAGTDAPVGDDAGAGRGPGATGGGLGGMIDRADAGDRGEVDPREGAPDEPTHPRVDPEESYEPPEDPAEEDAEILGGGPDDDRDPGEWPDDGDPAGRPADAGDAGAGTGGGDDEGTGAGDAAGAASGPAGEPGASGGPDRSGPSGDAGDARYVCEECGFAAPTVASSLREGDACPECNTGWLVVERGERNP